MKGMDLTQVKRRVSFIAYMTRVDKYLCQTAFCRNPLTAKADVGRGNSTRGITRRQNEQPLAIFPQACSSRPCLLHCSAALFHIRHEPAEAMCTAGEHSTSKQVSDRGLPLLDLRNSYIYRTHFSSGFSNLFPH